MTQSISNKLSAKAKVTNELEQCVRASRVGGLLFLTLGVINLIRFGGNSTLASTSSVAVTPDAGSRTQQEQPRVGVYWGGGGEGLG